jgi:hypothetical protein
LSIVSGSVGGWEVKGGRVVRMAEERGEVSNERGWQSVRSSSLLEGFFRIDDGQMGDNESLKGANFHMMGNIAW